MYILDTDHLSVLDRGGATASNLLQRLATVDPNSVATSIINYEEQMRGWMSYTAKAQAETQLIEAYRQLKRQLQNELLCDSGCRV
jgi:tRNA(fMet)-specific endonuclease VapC